MDRGVYEIRNQTNGNRYVGSSATIQQRWGNHLKTLRRDAHYNCHLQAAFNKYGESAFTFAMLEHVEDSSRLIAREQHYLETLNPEYNMCPTAGSPLGYRHTEEARRNMGVAHSLVPRTAEWRRKISEALKGRRFSEEHRKHLSEALTGVLKGRPKSEEHRRKMSEAHKGKRQSEEHRRKNSEGHKGKCHSEESKRKISEALSGECNPNYGKHPSAETRARMSLAQKARHDRLRVAEE